MARPSGIGALAGSEVSARRRLTFGHISGLGLLDLGLTGLGAIGAGVTIAAIAMLWHGTFATGSDLTAYIRAGDAVRNGAQVYTTGVAQSGAFLYSPVWAVLFAAVSWIPGPILQVAIIILDILSLRYATGSWRAVGWLGLYPLTWFGLASGNIDLLIVGALVATWRHTSVPLAIVSFAKISPAFGLDRRRIREFVITCVVLLAITLPWAFLWPQYAEFLLRQPAVAGTVIPIPWWWRVPVALLLLLPRRPWTSALAAIVAIPTLYWYSTLLLVAPMALILDSRPRWAPFGPKPSNTEPG